MFSCWQKTASEQTEISFIIRNILVVPCANTSRIYAISIDERLQLHIFKVIIFSTIIIKLKQLINKIIVLFSK